METPKIFPHGSP